MGSIHMAGRIPASMAWSRGSGVGGGGVEIDKGEQRQGPEVRMRSEVEDMAGVTGIPVSPRGWGFLTSARAGNEVVSDIQRVPRKHLSSDRVEAQELVTLEAVVAAEPSKGRGAVSNSWPVTLLFGFCSQVPEPCVVTFVQSVNKHLLSPALFLPCACTRLQGGPDTLLATWSS